MFGKSTPTPYDPATGASPEFWEPGQQQPGEQASGLDTSGISGASGTEQQGQGYGAGPSIPPGYEQPPAGPGGALGAFIQRLDKTYAYASGYIHATKEAAKADIVDRFANMAEFQPFRHPGESWTWYIDQQGIGVVDSGTQANGVVHWRWRIEQLGYSEGLDKPAVYTDVAVSGYTFSTKAAALTAARAYLSDEAKVLAQNAMAVPYRRIVIEADMEGVYADYIEVPAGPGAGNQPPAGAGAAPEGMQDAIMAVIVVIIVVAIVAVVLSVGVK